MTRLVCALLLLATAASAQETKPQPRLDEKDGLILSRLDAERRAVKAEKKLAEFQYQQKLDAIEQAITAAIQEAAKRSGIDLKDGWEPYPDQRMWRKPTTPEKN